ncbi:hypothetical protein [Acidianus bottle-shaped virus 3 strain ABV3]|uniref:Uncharacterized protein n=1 Tax=Acidianus bottle-shaped virus 3 strain ABV3 TaxID=1732174 RepID=A0A0N7FYX3_9VIRU|nr:hypothetical protein AVU00_gp18 [Acidianus bottle-shaped virus 3 strain ABV3]ALG96820.1 hypothetical protein [Acidianus bottle-shaped virus 3 strain ABV3]
MKLYTFGEVKIKILENKEEIESNEVEGCRSLCGDKAIELIGEKFNPCKKDWLFCHLIKEIQDKYFIILKEVV